MTRMGKKRNKKYIPPSMPYLDRLQNERIKKLLIARADEKERTRPLYQKIFNKIYLFIKRYANAKTKNAENG